MSSQTYLSTAQTAAKLNLSTQTVLSLVKSGKLGASFISRRWRFDPSEVESFVASHRRGGR